MELPNTDLGLIEEKASNLAERLSGRYVPVGLDDIASVRRLARWKQLAAGNDSQNFASVLAPWGMEQTSEANLLSLLGPVKRLPNVPAPPWVSFLREISDATAKAFSMHGDDTADLRPFGRVGRRVPFEPLYIPLCRFAWTQVMASHPAASKRLSAAARRGLEGYLLKRVSKVASQPLFSIFEVHKSIFQSGMMSRFSGMATGQPAATENRRLFGSFVDSQGRDGLRSFFTRYAVVARLVVEATLLWIDFVREFLARLETDRGRISARFNCGQPLGEVVSIKAGVSDPHHGGRSVLILAFLGGLRLVYKPRPMVIDRLFFSLVSEVNASQRCPRMRVLEVLDRGEYGWMEFAAHGPCSSQQAIQRFYQRAGALACLTHWLQGIDCHRENLVAAGEYPVLIDLETLGHPLRPDELELAGSGSPWCLANSVLRTGLLPLWLITPLGSTLYDISGLGAPVSLRSLLPLPRWQHVNTDRMEFSFAVRSDFHRPHRPLLKGRTVPIHAFERQLLEGYHAMEGLLKGSSNHPFIRWRDLLYGTIRRRIHRPTLVYAMLLSRSLAPHRLTDGIERSIELQGIPSRPGEEAQRCAEITSLEQQDIPYFLTSESEQASESTRTSTQLPNLSDQTETLRLSLRRKLTLRDGMLHRLDSRGKM